MFKKEALKLVLNEEKSYKYLDLYNRIKDVHLDHPFRYAVIISNENFDFLAPYLTAHFFANGCDVLVDAAPYGQLESYALGLKNNTSAVLPDYFFVLPHANTLVESFCDFSFPADQCISALLERYSAFVRMLTELGKPVISSNFIRGISPFDVTTGKTEFSYNKRIRTANNNLEVLLADVPNVDLVDIDALISQVGFESWYGHRDWYTARVPGGVKHSTRFATAMFAPVKRRLGILKKALAVDFDNTIWDGVIGEDTAAGISIGDSYPGNFFQTIQKALLSLKDAGVLLVALSKNNIQDIQPAFEAKQGMLLKLDDFVSLKINWDEKSENLKQVAKELNIGVDSFVFIDDNIVEIGKMQAMLPSVSCLQVPAKTTSLHAFLTKLFGEFSVSSVTSEDRQRSDMYQSASLRLSSKSESVDLNEFVRSLKGESSLRRVGNVDIDRVFQLHLKTNQFNLTTQRYSKSEIEFFVDNDCYQVYSGALNDKFGDLGIVFSCIVETPKESKDAYVRSLLMSCRAMGRKAEFTFLSQVIKDLQSKGFQNLLAEYIPTSKNEPAARFLSDFGFECTDQEGSVEKYLISTDIDFEIFSTNLGVKVNDELIES